MNPVAAYSADLVWWILGFVGAFLTIATQFMRTMIPLRTVAIAASLAFIGFAGWGQNWLLLGLHLVLLPINALRLNQMVVLVKSVRRKAHAGELSLATLEPYMRREHYRSGEVVFRRDEAANQLYAVISGRFMLPEIGETLVPGMVVGEVGLVRPQRQRSLSLICVEHGVLASVTYDKIEEICRQNPAFGYEFFRLVTARLLRDVDRVA